MKIRKLIALILALLLMLCLLAGCGAQESLSGGLKAEYSDAALGENEIASEEKGLTTSSQSSQTVTPPGQKLIRTVDLEAETADMDALLSDVEARIAQLGGYVENRSIYNGTNSSRIKRTAAMTIRIPADRLDQFVQQVSQVSNIIRHNESTKDVTLAYVDTESRVTALKAQEARLLELVAAAKDLDDLLTLEKRLTEVRTELERHKSQLKVYDNQVSYSTIYLDATEVREFTVVEEEEPEPTYFEKLGLGFVESVKTVWAILKGLSIFIVCAIPYLIIPGIVLAMILVPKAIRNRKQKKQMQEQQKQQDN